MTVKLQNTFQVLIKTIFIDTFLFIVEMLDMISEFFISDKEKQNREKRKSVLSKLSDPNDPYSAYKTCELPDRLKVDDPNANIFDEFQTFAKKYPNIQTLGTREIFSINDEIQSNGKIFKKYDLGSYKWHSYVNLNEKFINLSNGLLSIGMKSKKNIVIFSETRAEWIMCALSCFRVNVPVVTLYATLGHDALKFGIKETECTHVIASSDQLSKFEAIINEIPTVTHIIVIAHELCRNEVTKFKNKYTNIKVLLLDEVEEIGKQVELNYQTFEKPKRDDIAVIMYTSGSTGNPKGVMISHGNLLASMFSFPLRLGEIEPNKEIYVAYLPLAHILELTAELGCIIAGIKLGYSTPQTIADNSTAIKKGQKGDLRKLKPTVMTAVPLILERFCKAVNEKISQANWFTQALFQRAYEQKLEAFRLGRKTTILDHLVFRKISRTILGGKVKYIMCGASLLSEHVQEFLQVCLTPIRQAYALTETCAGGTGQFIFERSINDAGSVIAAAEMRLVDWEEGGYRVTDKPNSRGEIYIGGDNVTLGYYKMPEKTLEDYHTIDGVRYFATGDIGEVLPNGNLKIIDRKKDLVKLQGGEYVSLSKVEVTLKLLPYFDNCFAYANPLKNHAVCIICPNVEKIINYAKSIGVNDVVDFKTFNNNTEFLKLLQKDVEAHCLKNGLQRFEIPTKIKYVDEVWMPDSGLVTESFKLKRKALEKFYAKQLEQLYKY